MTRVLLLGGTARQTDQLEQMNAILVPETIVRDQRIQHVELLRVRGRILHMSQQGRHGPRALRVLYFRIVERAGCLCALTWRQGFDSILKLTR